MSTICSLCEKSVSSFKRLKKHALKRHGDVQFLHCMLCDYIAHNAGSMNLHRKELHPHDKFICSNCEYRTKRWQRLDRHVSVHNVLKMKENATELKKTSCGQKCNSDSLESHGLVATSNVMQVKCESDVFSSHMLNKDISTTYAEDKLMKEKNFMIADGCVRKQKKKYYSYTKSNVEEAFTKEKYEKKKNLNISDNPVSDRETEMSCNRKQTFKCSLCDYAVKNNCWLKRHMKIHTGEKPFKCDSCDYATIELSYLYRHKKIHSVIRPFHCSLCDYKSRRLGDLVCHERTHTGDRPYSCNFCIYTAKTYQCIQIHIKSHLNEKNYVCDICDFKTITRCQLSSHYRIVHLNERRFSCQICYKKLKYKSSLKKHMFNIHNEKFKEV